MKKRVIVALIIVLVITTSGVTSTKAVQHSQGSPNFIMPLNVAAGGGNEMASAHFTIKGTTGQTAIGIGSSASYQVGTGYWYGPEESEWRVYLPHGMRNTAP